MDYQRLLDMKADLSYQAQSDYLDELLSDIVRLCTRPGDVGRVAEVIDTLLGEIAQHRATEYRDGACE